MLSRLELRDEYPEYAKHAAIGHGDWGPRLVFAALNFLWRVFHSPRQPLERYLPIDVDWYNSVPTAQELLWTVDATSATQTPVLEFMNYNNLLPAPRQVLLERYRSGAWWTFCVDIFLFLCFNNGPQLPRLRNICNMNLECDLFHTTHLWRESMYQSLNRGFLALVDKCNTRRGRETQWDDIIQALAMAIIDVAPYHPGFIGFCEFIRMHSCSSWWKGTAYAIPAFHPYYAHFFGNCGCDDESNLRWHHCGFGYSSFHFPALLQAMKWPKTEEMVAEAAAREAAIMIELSDTDDEIQLDEITVWQSTEGPTCKKQKK